MKKKKTERKGEGKDVWGQEGEITKSEGEDHKERKHKRN